MTPGARQGRSAWQRLRDIAIAAAVFLVSAKAYAADFDRSREVVHMVYDIGLYSAELDRIMTQAESRGIYAGNTPAARARNRTTTHTLMLGQREAVLRATTEKVAARATDPELMELLHMAASSTPSANPQLVDEAVKVVKSSFEDALWDQLARTARGAAEFPCTREQRSRCS